MTPIPRVAPEGVRLVTRAGAPPSWYPSVKRLVDVVSAAAALVVLFPVLAIIAVVIWVESPGTVIFTQYRTGLHGRRFRMYKFRTMVADAEERKAELAHLNELPWPDFKITDDPRITTIGRFLRKTSLDELPQLVNVLLGQMSLIGPRPTSFAANTYDLWHTERLEVRPGLTGLWQVSGRNETTFDERLRMDIEYVRGVSPQTDLRILGRTLGEIVRGGGE